MYSSYSAAAFVLRAAKPSYNAHSSYIHSHHFDGESRQRELLPVNPHLSPRFLLDGYLLRHSTHLLLLSSRLRPPPPPHPPHYCRRREPACCYSSAGSGCGRSALEHVLGRLGTSGHRCCVQGNGGSDLGAVCRPLKAQGCSCGGSGHGKFYLGAYGRSDARRLLGRAVRQEVWEYEGGECSQRRCSMECYGDCGEEEEDECGLARREVPFRPRTRRWREEEDDDRCRDCLRRKSAESNYHDEGEYCGWRRESRDVNRIRGRFRDSDLRRLEQRGYNRDEDDTNMRRRRKMMEGRDMRDFEFVGAVAMRRVGAGRYSEDDRKYDRRREKWDFECQDVYDARRDEDGRYAEDDRRFDQRRERTDFEIDERDDVRREGRRHNNYDKRYLAQSSGRREEDASLLGSHRWQDKDCDDDDYQDIVDQKCHSSRKSERSALREDDSHRASSSRNKDPRLASNGKNAASRVWWHDDVDRRVGQTSEVRDQRYSSSVDRSNNKKDKYDYNDSQLARVRDSRAGAQDVKVIIEDDTSLASSSKNSSILKHHINIDHRAAAQIEDSKKSSERITDMSEIRHENTELGSTTQSKYREDGRKYIDNKSSSLQSSVKIGNDSRRQNYQHDEVDEQVATVTDMRTNSEKLTDIKIDSTQNVSRASLSQRNYDEVNQMDIDNRSMSRENITHIVRGKKRYVNQEVIHETDIDFQNVTHVDVSKVRTSDVSMSRSSQDHSEIKSDVNSISNISLIDSVRDEQIHQSKAMVSDSTMVKGAQSNFGTGIYDRVHSSLVTNVVDRTTETQEQVELTEARKVAGVASTSESHIQKRIDDRFQPSSSVRTAGTLKAQIDLTKIHASDTIAGSSSHDSSNNQVHGTLSINLVGNAMDSHDKSGQQMTQGYIIETNDQLRNKQPQYSNDSGEGHTREDTSRLVWHDVASDWQQAGTSRICDDKDIPSLEMLSAKEASMVDADVDRKGTLLGRSETTAGRSIPGGVTTRKYVNESLLESAAQLEKSSAFHAGQFVAELQKGVSDASTASTKKDEKSITEDLTSSSRSRMKGPSDDMWDVQSATSLETFKTADKEEVSSAYGGTNLVSQTPKIETAITRKVHKPLWAYVADIVRLGWIQRGESHDSSNKSVKKSSSSNSQSTDDWLSSQGHDSDDNKKRNVSTKPKDGKLMKSHGGESESRLASTPKDESFPTDKQSLQISEASNAAEVGRSKGDFVARVSRNDVPISGEKAKQCEMGESPKENITGGLAEDTTTLVAVVTEQSPKHDTAISSRIVKKGSAEINTGKQAQEVGQIGDDGNKRYGPSVATTPCDHPQAQAMIPHENVSSSFPRLPELPASGSTRSEEKIVVQEPPEIIRTDGKDAELKRRKIQRNKQVLKETFDEWEEAYQHDAEQRKTDELFMREALLEAQKAADIWEVPVGAVLVHNGEIIARGCNLVEDLRDSTAHAEIICIREASNKLKTWRLADTTLYVTLEPCAMCAGAILQARVDTVVWGTPNKLLGADGSWVRLFPGDGQTSTLDPANQNQTSGPVHPFHPKIIIRRGVLSMECSEIMQQFFQLRRRKKQKPESPPRAHLHHGHRHNPIKFFSKMHHMFGTIFCL